MVNAKEEYGYTKEELQRRGELERVASRYDMEEKIDILKEYKSAVKFSPFSRNEEVVFQPFQTLHIGSYELFSLFSADDEDGCSNHYIYIDRK